MEQVLKILIFPMFPTEASTARELEEIFVLNLTFLHKQAPMKM